MAAEHTYYLVCRNDTIGRVASPFTSSVGDRATITLISYGVRAPRVSAETVPNPFVATSR